MFTLQSAGDGVAPVRGPRELPPVPESLDVECRHSEILELVRARARGLYESVTGCPGPVDAVVERPLPGPFVQRADLTVSGPAGTVLVEVKGGWVQDHRISRQLKRYRGALEACGEKVAASVAVLAWSPCDEERERFRETGVRVLSVPVGGVSPFEYTLRFALLPPMVYVVDWLSDTAVVLARPGHVLVQEGPRARQSFADQFPSVMRGSIVCASAQVSYRHAGGAVVKPYWRDSGHPGCTWRTYVRPDFVPRPAFYAVSFTKERKASAHTLRFDVKLRPDESGVGQSHTVDLAEFFDPLAD